MTDTPKREEARHLLRERGDARTHDFQSCTFGLSVTSPGSWCTLGLPLPRCHLGVALGRNWFNWREIGRFQLLAQALVRTRSNRTRSPPHMSHVNALLQYTPRSSP